MEDTRKEISNKAKRLKTDRIKHVMSVYYQKRNYKIYIPREITFDEYMRCRTVHSKVSQPNILFFACWNNKEALVIDNNYCKFLSWLKEIKLKNGTTDLDNLTGPLFCYMYLELLRKGLLDQATAFFRSHISSVDKSKCDTSVKELISAVASNATELNGIKDTFRSNKYVINLSPLSCRLLKRFILAKCHIVFLQMVSLWFQIHENVEEESVEEIVVKKPVICNGYINKYRNELEQHVALVRRESSPLYTVQLHHVKDDVTCGLLSRSNRFVAYCHNNSTYIRSIGTLRKVASKKYEEIVFRNHTGRIYDIKLAEKPNFLITASFDRNICMIDLNTYTRRSVLTGHNHPVYSLATSCSGAYLVSGSYDATIRLWSLERNNSLRVYAGHRQEITSLDFHPNSVYFASSSADKAVRMWTVSAPMPVRLLYGSEGAVYCVKMSPNGRLIACSGEDKVLRVWDILASKQLLELKYGKESVIKMCWSGDQKTLVTGSANGIVRTWNIDRILKNPTNTSLHEPLSSITLDSKLLHLEYSLESYACLFTQNKFSTLM